MTSRRIMLAILFALGSGCSAKKVTEIVVSVATDLKVRDELEIVELEVRRVRGAADNIVVHERWDIGDAKKIPDAILPPFTFGLLPGTEPDHLLHVTVRGLHQSRPDKPLIRVARLGYVRDRILHLPMNLLKSCLYISCPGGTTCQERGCQNIDIDANTLADFDPNRPLKNPDGGLPFDLRVDRSPDGARPPDGPRPPDRPPKTEVLKPDSLACVTPKQTASCPGGWCQVPAGCFYMGSPESELCHQTDETLHPVTLTHSLEVAETEVTEGQFQTLMGYDPSNPKLGATYPVNHVTYHEAQAYCAKLSQSKGVAPCFTCGGTGWTTTCTIDAKYASSAYQNCPGYRLPSEAEQEHFIRAGTQTALYNGAITNCGTDPNADAIAWYWSNSGSAKHPVKTRQPNGWGLHDTVGNLIEWTHDGYTGDLGPVHMINPIFPSGVGERVLHGTHFGGTAQYVRSANRQQRPASPGHWVEVGFRCVRSLN